MPWTSLKVLIKCGAFDLFVPVTGCIHHKQHVGYCRVVISKAKLFIRGRVEDTRLEAKAKDSRSEDRPPRGQGQGHRRKCSPKKKKVFKKVFQAISN